MNSIEYVSTRLESLIQMGAEKPEIVKQMALATDGWPYVFGAWGEQCTPANRRRRKSDDHPTIVSKCQVLNGSKSSCTGCKWNLPVDMFDCRGFTYWCLKQAGIIISGGGCTSQWNTASNWAVKGTIDEMPRDKLCCVFVKDGSKMSHTGLYLGDGTTMECSNGVQHKNLASKWTHYAIPAFLYSDLPEPTTKPTLRKGDSGTYVTLLQTELIQRGYDCGKAGADGKFGSGTLAAVKSFQSDNGLEPDGVVGSKTWTALDSSEPVRRYRVTISGLTLTSAEALRSQYSNAVVEEEPA